MKKFLKIAGIVIGVILLLLFLTPYLFKDQLKNLVQKTINDNLNANVAFQDVNVSLLRHFPNASVAIKDLSVVNKAPFEGDTLVTGKEIVLQMSVMELFNNSGEAMRINDLRLNQAKLNLKVDSLGNANYDIALKDDAPVTDSSASSGFQFDVQHYEIKNSNMWYYDEASKMRLQILDLVHEGTGDFSAKRSNLETYSTALVSFSMDSTQYLNKNKLELDADFEMDLENQKYTFLENEAKINKLPLTFDGFVQLNNENTEVALTFKTPSSSFKNFLAVIPEEYSKDIEQVKTTGDFKVTGKIEGIVDDTHIPKIDVNIASENASFKYPDLPKSVEDIQILAEIKNETGIVEDTYINIDKLNFRIDQDAFHAQGKIQNLLENMLVNMAVNGTINLANLKQAYPLDLDMDLNGMLTADLSMQFDINSIEKEQYQNVKSSGTASLRNFKYTSDEIPNPVEVKTADFALQEGNFRLKEMKAITGKTDMDISGSIQNLMGFLFTDQKLKGDFSIHSNQFSVNDFMVADSEDEEETKTDTQKADKSPEEAIKIPSFLDATISFTADKVLYDNLVLQNTKGKLQIKDETASLVGVNSHIFGGTISLDGTVSTAGKVPDFKMDLGLNSIDIAQSFQDLELLRNLAPIARALQGKLTTNIDLKGNLNPDLTPILQTLAGDALAEILDAEVDPEKTPLLSQLDQKLNFINLDSLNLKDLKTHLTFTDGRVNVAPFDFTIKGIQVKASGSHGFDQSMDYQLVLDIPAKYLGNDFTSTLSKLNGQKTENTMVPLPIDISGNFKNPKIGLDMKTAVNNLTQGIVEEQKDNLKEKGKDILSDILKSKTDKDSTQTETDSVKKQNDPVKDAAKSILGNILGKKKKKKDSVPEQDTTQTDKK